MSGEKTEPPSAKRLRKAREDGNVSKSKDFSSAVLFLVGAAIIGGTSPSGVEKVKAFTIRCLSIGAEPSDRLRHLTTEIALDGGILLLQVIAPLFGALFFLAIVVGAGMTGGLFSLKVLQFKLEKLNPVSGIKNTFFSARAYVELLKSMAKLFVAGYLGYSVMRSAIRDITVTQRLTIEQSVFMTGEFAGQIIKKIGGFLIVIGVFDLFYQRYNWNKGLMMSKQELKDEYKQSEGDPHTKGKRKQLAKELMNQKGVKAVKHAKVVVTNPDEIAVALEYEPEEGMSAPQILCKGERLVAQQIIEEAEKHGVPIMRNIALAHSLNELEAGDEVPEDLYDAIAEVLNWVYAQAAGEEYVEGDEDDWGDEDEDEEW